GVGGRAGEAADHLAALTDPADLLRIGLDHRRLQRDLPVAGDHRLAVLAHADDRRAVPHFHGLAPAPAISGMIGRFRTYLGAEPSPCNGVSRMPASAARRPAGEEPNS